MRVCVCVCLHAAEEQSADGLLLLLSRKLCGELVIMNLINIHICIAPYMKLQKHCLSVFWYN